MTPGVRRHKTRKHYYASSHDRIVMKSLPVARTAQLDDFNLPARFSIVARNSIHADHSVYDAVQLQVRVAGTAIIEQQYGTCLVGHEVFERENLAAVTQWILCQHAQFTESVIHQPVWAH